MEFRRDSIALAADWLQVCERITQVVARQRVLIAERLAALEDRRSTVPVARESA